MAKFIILVSSVLLSVYGTELAHFLSQDYINKINDVTETWKANQYFHPDTSIESMKRLLGVKSFGSPVNGLNKEGDRVYVTKKEIPKFFDARTQWKNCKTIRNIPNQGDCGSCWAIGVAGAFADRLCIATNATRAYNVPVKYIQQELLAYGPLEAGYNVYSDFYSYSSGVYKKSFFSKKLGKHAVKLISWGEEKGVLYWTLIDSWGEKWREWYVQNS